MAFDNILHYVHCFRILPPFLENLPSSHSRDSRRVPLVSNPSWPRIHSGATWPDSPGLGAWWRLCTLQSIVGAGLWLLVSSSVLLRRPTRKNRFRTSRQRPNALMCNMTDTGGWLLGQVSFTCCRSSISDTKSVSDAAYLLQQLPSHPHSPELSPTESRKVITRSPAGGSSFWLKVSRPSCLPLSPSSSYRTHQAKQDSSTQKKRRLLGRGPFDRLVQAKGLAA